MMKPESLPVKLVLLVSLVMTGPAPAGGTVPYPAYEGWEAAQWEKRAAECFARLGPEPACARLLETALELSPDRASSHYTLGWYYHGKGDSGRALAAFASALRLDSSLVGALLGMGEVYLEQGQLGRAEEKLRQYVASRPRDPAGQVGLATLAAQRGEVSKAVEGLKKALALGFTGLDKLESDPRWASVKGDPRFKRLK